MCNVEKQLIPQRYHHQIIKAPTLLHEWPVMNGIHKDNASLGLKMRKKTCVCISALFYWASLPLSAADTERWHHLLRTLTTLHRSQETLAGGCPLVVYWPPRGSSYTVVSRVFVEPKTINHVWHCASDVWQNPVSPAQSSPLLDSCAVCWNWPWLHMTDECPAFSQFWSQWGTPSPHQGSLWSTHTGLPGQEALSLFPTSDSLWQHWHMSGHMCWFQSTTPGSWEIVF